MSLSPICQRYLAAYPIKFTTIRPPFWFWLGIDTLPDTISDADLKAKAMADYEEDKGVLEFDAALTLKMEIIENLYIKAYTFSDDIEGSTSNHIP